MLEGALVILGIFLFIGITSLISHRSMKRRRKIFIHEKFGKAPTPGEWNENVRTYYDVVGGGSADDITWNDLSMNEVFQRIDGCDTSVGQEVLYWKMRRNQMSFEERQLLSGVCGRSDRTRKNGNLWNIFCAISEKVCPPIISLPIWTQWKNIC